MISVFVYGLDQFVVGDLSISLSKDLAKVYEVDEDDINFVAPNTMIFHKRAEQTSWRVIVEVSVPKKLEVLQEQAEQVIAHHIKQVAIHVEILFKYYLSDHHTLKVNEDYPLYLEEKEDIEIETEYPEDIQEGEGEDEIYTGDIFEGLK